jgi:biopolymer transport protein ExbD
MSMGGVSSRDKLQSDINVTPLVDVCLVLLIIFMVVTPLLQKGIAVQLPTTDNPDKKPENASQKLVTVGWATPPAYYLEAEQLSKENLQKRLEELYQRSPNAEIIIKADQRLKYGAVKEVMRLAKEAGFQNVGLIADKKQKGIAAKS